MLELLKLLFNFYNALNNHSNFNYIENDIKNKKMKPLYIIVLDEYVYNRFHKFS